MIFEYLTGFSAIFPASKFDAALCNIVPVFCAEPTTLTAPVAIERPDVAAPVIPPINVPDIKPVHTPSNAPSQPFSIEPEIAPETAPDIPPDIAPVNAAPAITPAAPPVQTVATANPAIATAPTATFAQFGSDQLPSASVRFTGLFKQ